MPLTELCLTVRVYYYYYYYYYYTIWMSLVTGLFFLVLLLNQRWSPPLRLQASQCSTFRIMCDAPSVALLLLLLLLATLLWNLRHIFKPLLIVVLRYLHEFICVTVLRLACASFWMASAVKLTFQWMRLLLLLLPLLLLLLLLETRVSQGGDYE